MLSKLLFVGNHLKLKRNRSENILVMSTTALTSRRHHLSEFRDLFTALFRITDREVQTRVLDAINGIVHDDPGGQCQCKRNLTYSDASAQTTLLLVKPFAHTKAIQTDQVSVTSTAVQATGPILINSLLADNQQNNQAVPTANYRVVNKEVSSSSEICIVEEVPVDGMDTAKSSPTISPDPSPVSSPKPVAARFVSMDDIIPVIRRRKRAKKVPRVEKVEESNKSRLGTIVQDNMSQGFKRMKQDNYETEYHNYIHPRSRDSVKRNSDQIVQLLNCYTEQQINNSVSNLESSKNIMEQMKNEWQISLVIVNGFYPIHKAIFDNEVSALKRQIYVLKFRKINIHKMFTDNDESPLQLAVKNNSIYLIVSELVNSGADVNEVDKDSNTIIHLAMMYSDNPKVLHLLLTRANINILNLYNDQGNTALHVGVSEDKFYMCKTFLEYIDQIENLTTVGVGIEDKDRLLHLYRMEINKFPSLDVVPLNKQKQSIINEVNRRNGRTALFLALSNRLEHAEIMIMMLLTHCADPRVTDFNGMDCSAYALDSNEIHRYNDALDNAALYFERLSFDKN